MLKHHWWSDSYALHETHRNVKSLIWVGRKGLEWILTCLKDIRDWVPGHVLLCKRFKENGKLLEFCGRYNKAGLFVVIAVYFGGSKRGCIMIPASSNRAGWSLFQKELRIFCSGAKPISLAKVSFNNGGGGGKLVGGGRSGKFLSVYGNQQKIRNFDKIGTFLGNVMHGKSIENVSVIKGNVSAFTGRPTRAFQFKLTPATLELRVCKPENGRRSVTWLGDKVLSWPKVLSDGPEVTKQLGGPVVAQPEVQMFSQLKGSLVKPNVLQVQSNAQASWVVGESSSRRSGDPEPPVLATVPELGRGASTLTGDLVHVVSVVSPSAKALGATDTAELRFIGEEIQFPMAEEFSGGRLTRPRGSGKVFLSPQWYQGATLSHFSPL